MTPRAGMVAVFLTAGLGLGIGCDGGFFHEPGGPGFLDLAASFARSAGGPGSAYDRSDRVSVVLTPVGGGDVIETDAPFTAEQGETRVRVSVTLREESQEFDLEVALESAGASVFTAQTRVTLTRGRVTEAAVTLEPVTASVQGPGAVLVDELGSTVQLTGAALFATGDTVPGAPLAWRVVSQEPAGVVTLTPTGLLTALGEGQAEVEVSSGGLTDAATVTVHATVQTVQVEPDAWVLLVGGTVQLQATALDAGGSALQRGFEWSSGAPAIASVDPLGLVAGLAAGDALVTASTEGVEGFSQITVVEPAPTVFTGTADAITTGASLSGTINPNGLPTLGWFEWGSRADLADAEATPSVSVGNGMEPVTFSDRIPDGTLDADGVYYFRSVGENTSGVAMGDIESFRTPSLPTASTAAPQFLTDPSSGAPIIRFQATANTFGLPGTGWFEFSTVKDFSQVLGQTQPRGIGSSDGSIPFSEDVPQQAFQCCIVIYVRAIVSSAMGVTPAAPSSFIIPG